MYVNTLISLQENIPTYGVEGKTVTGHVTISTPGIIKCYVQNLKRTRNRVFELYVLSSKHNTGVKIGELGEDKETKWRVDERNVMGGSIALQDIDGVAIIVKENEYRGVDAILIGFKNERFTILPILESIVPRPSEEKVQSQQVQETLVKEMPVKEITISQVQRPSEGDKKKENLSEQEPAQVIQEREKSGEGPAPVMPEREEAEEELAPVIQEREEQTEEPAPVIQEREEQTEEPVPVIPEREKTGEEPTSVSSEREEQTEESASVIPKREELEDALGPMIIPQFNIPEEGPVINPGTTIPGGSGPVINPETTIPGGPGPVIINPGTTIPGGSGPVINPETTIPGGPGPVIINPGATIPGGPGPVINPETTIPGGPGPVINPETTIPGGPGPVINSGITIPEGPGPAIITESSGPKCVKTLELDEDDPDSGVNENDELEGGDSPVIVQEENTERTAEEVKLHLKELNENHDDSKKDSLDDAMARSNAAIKKITERLKQSISKIKKLKEVEKIQEARKTEGIEKLKGIEEIQRIRKVEQTIKVEKAVELARRGESDKDEDDRVPEEFWNLDNQYDSEEEVEENLSIKETPEEIDYLVEIEKKLHDIQSRLKNLPGQRELEDNGETQCRNIELEDNREAQDSDIESEDNRETQGSDIELEDNRETQGSDIESEDNREAQDSDIESEDNRETQESDTKLDVYKGILEDIYAKGDVVESFIQEPADTEWVKIPYGEFIKIPSLSYTWCTQPFITFAFYKYNEILLGHNGEGKYYLGIPDIYHPDRKDILSDPIPVERFLCRQNIEPVVGEYGYWIIPIHLEDSK